MFKELASDLMVQYAEESWVSTLLVSLAIIVAALVIHFVTFRLLKRFYKTSPKSALTTLGKRFKTPSLVFLLALALNIIVYAFAPDNPIVISALHVLKLVIIAAVTLLVIRFINLGRELVLMRYDLGEKDNLKARKVFTQFRIIERIIIFIIILISIAIALMTFESIRRIGVSLFASAGVAGLIIGFAAQKLIGNFLAGLQIAVTQPIRIDDVVIVESEWGKIEEITLTYVVVRIWDLRRMILPTTYFIEKPFQNWTRVSADISGTVFLYTDYSVPFDKVREKLTEILKADKNWDGKVNVLQVTDSTEKTVEIRALMSAADSSAAWDLRVNVREQLISFLQQNYPESLPRSRVEISKGTVDER